MTCTDDIRYRVMALPEAEETSHFRFRTPVWKVRGRTFLGLEVVLGNLSAQQIRELAEMAWRQQAPKRLAAERDQGRQPALAASGCVRLRLLPPDALVLPGGKVRAEVVADDRDPQLRRMQAAQVA